MTRQAQNSINLYKGQDPSKIQQLLQIQGKSVVNELMSYFNARDIAELAIKLSINK